jgi:hypothetical protein
MISVNPALDQRGNSTVSDDDLLSAIEKSKKTHEIEKIGVGTSFSNPKTPNMSETDRYNYLKDVFFHGFNDPSNNIIWQG